MSTIERSIDVQATVNDVYNQWTQFESFPKFMEGVEEVKQLSDTRTHWKTEIAGVAREFDAEITEQHPDERVAWRAVDGPTHAGVVTFHRIDSDTTRIMLQMDFEPEGLAEKAGDLLGVVERRAAGDLERFKDFIEKRGNAEGAWRGDVDAAPQHGKN